MCCALRTITRIFNDMLVRKNHLANSDFRSVRTGFDPSMPHPAPRHVFSEFQADDYLIRCVCFLFKITGVFNPRARAARAGRCKDSTPALLRDFARSVCYLCESHLGVQFTGAGGQGGQAIGGRPRPSEITGAAGFPALIKQVLISVSGYRNPENMWWLSTGRCNDRDTFQAKAQPSGT